MANTDGVATCGHDDWIGYISDAPCLKCVRKIHREAVQGRTTTLDKINQRKVVQP